MSNTLNDLRFQLKHKAQLAARRMDGSWEADLRRTGPVDTGRLSRATTVTHIQSRNRIVWEAKVDVPYAEAQAFGARPHVIFPTRAQALRFYWGKAGRVVYFKKVNHPGNQANPWWKNSLRDQRQRLQRVWDSV